MSLKTYDRKGQVWYMHPRDISFSLTANNLSPTTVIVTGTSCRIKKSKLIVYDVIVSSCGKVWAATLADNLTNRWEQQKNMHRLA